MIEGMFVSLFVSLFVCFFPVCRGNVPDVSSINQVSFHTVKCCTFTMGSTHKLCFLGTHIHFCFMFIICCDLIWIHFCYIHVLSIFNVSGLFDYLLKRPFFFQRLPPYGNPFLSFSFGHVTCCLIVCVCLHACVFNDYLCVTSWMNWKLNFYVLWYTDQ